MARQIHVEELLRTQAEVLHGAMLAARTDADKGPVHKLRTGTRRMEAQLALLALLPGLPPHDGPAADVHRLLRRVRRAAAAVRDLDVQAEMIAADVPERAALTAGSRGDRVYKQAGKLQGKLEKRRAGEAKELLSTLRAESEPLAEAMRVLLEALAPAPADETQPKRRPARSFAPAELSGRVQQWFARQAAQITRTDRHVSRDVNRKHALQRLQHMNDDTLHDLRKLAKQCRYMAESLPEGAHDAERLSVRFEYIQQAGGHWHDWLMLEEVAARTLGKKTALAERYRIHRAAALAEYHLQLALELTTGPHQLKN